MAHDRSLPMGDRDDPAADYNQPRLVKEVRDRHPRRYTLFRWVSGERWERLGAVAYPIEKAQTVFQGQIMRGWLEGERMELRVVRRG